MIANQDLVFLGLDISQQTTRATLFGVVDGRYRLLGQGSAQTTIGMDEHLGEGVGKAIKVLEKGCKRKLLNNNGSPIQPIRADGSGLDRIAITISAGPALRTVVTGLTSANSLKAGRALVESLPLNPAAFFGMDELMDESGLVDRIVQKQPELIVMTGGENDGAEKPLDIWIEIIRRVLLLLEEADRPKILYAGNPALWELARRRLEPLTPLSLTANLLPEAERTDLLPAQAVLNRLIVDHWMAVVPGLKELAALAENRVVCRGFGLNRMVRFLSRPASSPIGEGQPHGVMVVSLGVESTRLAVGLDGECLSIRQCPTNDSVEETRDAAIDAIWNWMPEEIARENVAHYTYRRMLNPGWVPSTQVELAFEQAYARYRLQLAGLQIFRNYSSAPFDPENGWRGHFEPIIASGEVLDRASTPGQVMLMLLDGLQPRGVTTLVLDKFRILPLLGLLGEIFPILPIHLLETDVFQNLGTVITADSPAPEGEHILTLQVIKESGGGFDVDIQQGSLRRVVIQVNEPVVLVLKPGQDTDVGFGEPGLGGRLKVTGGTLGVVVDARSRPISVAADPSERVAQLQRWGWTLGAGE